MNIDLLSKDEIKKASKKYRKNIYKKTLFENNINDYLLPQKAEELSEGKIKFKNRIEMFDYIYLKSDKLIRNIRGWGHNKDERTFSEFTAIVASEFINYKSSLLSNFYKIEKGKNRYIEGTIKTYNERVEEFMKEWGSENVEYDGVSKTLDEWLIDFNNKKLGDNIRENQLKMNDIINKFKMGNSYDVDPSEYIGRNYESGQSITNDRFGYKLE